MVTYEFPNLLVLRYRERISRRHSTAEAPKVARIAPNLDSALGTLEVFLLVTAFWNFRQ